MVGLRARGKGRGGFTLISCGRDPLWQDVGTSASFGASEERGGGLVHKLQVAGCRPLCIVAPEH